MDDEISRRGAAPGTPAQDGVHIVRQDGSYVLHRVCRVTPEALWFVGDAQSFIEGPIPRESLVASVRTVIRRGRVIGPRSPVWIYHSARRAVKTHKMRLRAILSALVKRKEKEK